MPLPTLTLPRLMPRFMLTALLPLLLALTGALAGAARAATLTVTTTADSGAGSLRQALAAAQSGDTITFAPGVTDIALTGGQLTDAGVSIVGPGVTLDAGGHSRVLEVSGGTSASPVTLSGLTLKNGSAGSTGIGGGARVDQNAYVALTACALTGDSAGLGGGLFSNFGGTLTLTGCTFTGDSASGNLTNQGGGLFNFGGTLTMTGCTFTGNSAPGGSGGGLGGGGTATLTACTFTGNSVLDGAGGGIEFSSGTLTLTGCTLAQNSAAGGNGGGLENGGTATLTACALTGDSALYGGGLENGGTLTLTQCALTGDSAVNEGGGLINGGTLTLTGCALAQNTAGQGGGLFNLSTLTLTGCTVTQNSAGQSGGLYNSGGTVTLTDDILYGDTATQGGSEVVPNGGTVTAAYSDIGEALGADGVTDGGHNFDADPLFVGAPGDLHLKPGSPAAGRGVAAAGNATDLDGRTRATPPTVGAYEAAPAGAYSLVVENTADALPLSLRAAVQAADDYPGAAITFDPAVFGTAQTVTLTSGQLTLTQPTTITGPAPGVAISGNNSSRVFEVSGGTSSAPVALTGLTVEDGTDAQDGNGGGGIRVNSGYVTLTACALTGDSGGGGGGLANFGGTLTLTACALTGNSASDGGGGLYNNRGTATLTGCTLTGNTAAVGGGLYNYLGTLTLTDDILYGDSSQSGGEVHNNGGTTTATYSDIQGGYPGTGNLSADPLFDAELPGYAGPTPDAVQPGSPVVGAGIAAPGNGQDITGKTRANPPTIGAYEGTAATTKTAVAGNPSPSAVGKTVTFTVVVTNTAAGSSATPTGSVTVSFGDGTSSGPVSLSGGQAAPSHAYTAPGSYTVKVTYTPAANNFTGSSSSVMQTVIGTPTANAQSVSVVFNTPKAITLTGTDPDVPALSLTYAVAAGPSHGTLTGFNAGTGAVTYTPRAGYSGPDAFTFTVSNGVSTSAPATVSLTIAAPAPATVTAVSAQWGTAGTAALTAGPSLLPAGRSADVPWLGVSSFTVTLSAPESLSASDVSVTGVSVSSYGPVTVTGSGTSYTVTLAQPVALADRVTLTLGNAGITSFSGTLPVLPGDVSGDGSVNASDMVLARNAIGSANAYADVNGDGAVDTGDYTLVRQRVGTRLP